MTLAATPLIAFVATADPIQSRAFYEELLGLRLVADDPFALVFDAMGTMLRISKVQRLSPVNYTVLGWAAADITATVRDLTNRGVEFERYDGFEQDADGIAAFPNGDRVAWFRDPDGNTLSVTQFA